MTDARDLRELIAEQSTDPVQRKALEATATRLEHSLSQEVPYRPEFKAELRRKLMAQARRQAPPAWYRRTAVWGTTAAMAAAVTILAVGLQLWNNKPGAQPSQPPVAVAPTGQGGEVNKFQVSGAELPDVTLPDELLPAGAAGVPDSIAGLNWSQGLAVYKIPGRPDQSLFNAMAARLGFHGQPVAEAGGGWSAVEGARTLRLTADGHVTYADAAPAVSTARVESNGAAAAAQSFLDRAALPMPSNPTVLADAGRGQFRVIYTMTVAQRPVVNGGQQVTVNESGTVVAADAFVQAVPEQESQRAVIKPDDALAKARAADGSTFDGVDLVYVRGAQGQTAYLLPCWRVYGTNARGARFVRYVAALAPGK